MGAMLSLLVFSWVDIADQSRPIVLRFRLFVGFCQKLHENTWTILHWSANTARACAMLLVAGGWEEEWRTVGGKFAEGSYQLWRTKCQPGTKNSEKNAKKLQKWVEKRKSLLIRDEWVALRLAKWRRDFVNITINYDEATKYLLGRKNSPCAQKLRDSRLEKVFLIFRKITVGAWRWRREKLSSHREATNYD